MQFGDREHSIFVSELRLRERRKRLGMTQGDLGDEAGVNRDTVGAAEKDWTRVYPATLDKIVRTLERLEEEAGLTVPRPALEENAHLIEFEVTGDFGVRVFVRGPVSDADAVERAAARLVRNIREGRTDGEGDD